MHKWFLLPLLPLGIAIAYFFTGTNDEVLAQGKVVAAPQPALPALLPPAAPLAKAAVGEGLAAAIAELAGQKFRHGSAEGKLVALTFDDGPHPQMTPQVLAALKEAGVPATFFMVGTMLEKYPEVARQVAAEGHEIGGHSHSHKPLTSRTREQVREEIMRTQAAIRQVTGEEARLFRPPFGTINGAIREICRENGLVMVLWSVDPEDWRARSSVEIETRVMKHAHGGAVVCMHDIKPNTVAALPKLIAELKAEGYRFTTVSGMIGAAARSAEGLANVGSDGAAAAAAQSVPVAPVSIPLSQTRLR